MLSYEFSIPTSDPRFRFILRTYAGGRRTKRGRKLRGLRKRQRGVHAIGDVMRMVDHCRFSVRVPMAGGAD